MIRCYPAGKQILVTFVLAALAFACERGAPREDARASAPSEDAAQETAVPGAARPDAAPTPTFRNIETPTAYVGDSACAGCHVEAVAAYGRHAMARSFHPWAPETRVEPTLETPLRHPRSGHLYTVVEQGGALYQVERLVEPGGRILHELRRRIDHVMGSGVVARTYFTELGGRLFQLPLTWYAEAGWDFSPGYELDNARFGRLLPDRCLACHASYPDTLAFLEGKYAALRPGVGCERCHGPGALHVAERAASPPPDGGRDSTIVDPARLPLERRLDLCEQCHVHTPVTVLREGHDAFDYLPAQPLEEHAAFFRVGGIDLVSHADRLRQSACFRATRIGDRPLECATCHDPHAPPPAAEAFDAPCLGCHEPAAIADRLGGADADHGAGDGCVRCHMPGARERTVPHGAFTDHWIRVVDGTGQDSVGDPAMDDPLQPYYERDRSGPESALYGGMARIVYATLADDPGQLREGADALARALGSDTARADAWFLLGLAYDELGRGDEAVRALELAARAEPVQPARLRALARAYARARASPDTVDALYERALAIQPALAWIGAERARFLYGRGRLEEAAQAYRTALAERPDLAVAAFELGTLEMGVGRLREAAEAFEAAVRLDPSLAEALAPLLQVRVREGAITGARFVGSPIPTLPVRDRGPGAVRVVTGAPGARFLHVPAGASVRILDPEGSLVRALPPAEDGTVAWDLADGRGSPIGGGLYEIHVAAPAAEDGAARSQRFYLGIIGSR